MAFTWPKEIKEGEKQTPGVQQDRATLEAVFRANDEMAAYFLTIGKRTEAISLYRANVETLGNAPAPTGMVSLALDYEHLRDALAPSVSRRP